MKKLISLFVILLTISCSTVDDLNTSTQNPVDVYIAGVKNYSATYWKNNQPYLLSGGDGGEATKICVSNNNVHVLGKKTSDNWITEYLHWENGNLTNLNTAFNTPAQYVHSITDMEIVGNDVYFVGYTKNPLISAEIYELVYWKNGVKTVLDNNINNPTFQAKIKVVNNVIYVIGYTSNCFNSCHGIYINNAFQSVYVGDLLKDITVKENQVYVYGTNTSTNTGFYKNMATGVETNLTTIPSVYKLLFDNNNTYVADGVNIFKNNTQIYSSSFFSFYIDFIALNNNVYILKREGDFGTFDALYVNDVNVFQIFVDQGKFNALTVVQN
ncbi:hypothetical protein [Flavobacterium sp.]|uniref:hypothetical protein n=1 Tax=Flavobacterium sp. TaxID=239 RepID=UPI001B50796C|nr:hypothetical protein [Flavobacterium sp.]MBP6127915.1 hypothetical protein [Flavobacterium sp.]